MKTPTDDIALAIVKMTDRMTKLNRIMRDQAVVGEKLAAENTANEIIGIEWSVGVLSRAIKRRRLKDVS